ncbi:tRNA pseudouridine(55) synthase TruB [Spirochaetia bacterium 38H-sp]|uniref:tRNA pseudouridine synthase B n=1 Tax=Rarispira pelagica TaxID=3141764 RepID=A0ABU9UAW5_9SPIR
MNGFLIVDKPSGFTSNDIIIGIKKKLGLKKEKLGHTGTLDKFATGILLLLVGKFTKLSSVFNTFPKSYTAKIRLGLETDTLDPSGEVVSEEPVPSRESFTNAIKNFIGEILQTPPVYSAVKINGKRASDRHRNGEAFVIPSRKINIYSMELLTWNPPYAEVKVLCSSGTYIRALARDIAKSAHSCSYVEELRRESIGPITIDTAVSFDSIQKDNILDINSFLEIYPDIFKKCYIKEDNRYKIKNGMIKIEMLETPHIKDGVYAIFSRDEELLSFVDYKDDRFLFLCNM